jgi:formylmethanofuran dehydrogenase subunit E
MKKEIAAMVVRNLKSSTKKEKIVTFEKEKNDEDLYDLVRGGKSAMMVQRRDGEGEYIPRRKVIMMISSESDEDYTPKRPSGNNKNEKKEKDTKKSEIPIKNGKTEKMCFRKWQFI